MKVIEQKVFKNPYDSYYGIAVKCEDGNHYRQETKILARDSKTVLIQITTEEYNRL